MIALLILSSAGCQRANYPEHCPEMLNTYFRQDEIRQREEWSEASNERRYDIFVCSQEYIVPPRLQFADAFAAEGASVVPFLGDKLRRATDDESIKDIIFVFVRMDRIGTYDAKSDSELMALMTERAADIGDPFWRGQVQSWLSGIGEAELPTHLGPEEAADENAAP